MNFKRLVLAVILMSGFGGRFCAAEEITVAAASDLQFAFHDAGERFEKATGKQVKLIFGSSGNFFAQLQNGAPFDVFFSADIDYPRRLETAGLAEPGTLYSYATGRIVLWAPMQSKLDLGQGLRVLLDPGIHKIAIANPAHAPYGRAAVAALRHEDLYDQVSPKFVLGENISQTATFVVSGGADVGILALSLALAPSMKDKGRYAEIAVEDYPAIEQGAVILKSSPHKDIARQFIEFVKTPPIQDLLRSYGFAVPSAPAGKAQAEKLNQREKQ
ncbi:MAG TPA: molybdate ABC transporter substrate-binding protein [Terriglobales bacterium]|jgi:molybdate transport system substrate-binding protein|nr:molybdate ABC transporter substrate-binding protein [Terriglobales bacterium]